MILSCESQDRYPYQASGGPCSYVGLGLKSAHAGMDITTAEFNALVGDLITTLNKFTVGRREQSELLSVLSRMRQDTVERR